jgi:hypothetical protein
MSHLFSLKLTNLTLLEQMLLISMPIIQMPTNMNACFTKTYLEKIGDTHSKELPLIKAKYRLKY